MEGHAIPRKPIGASKTSETSDSNLESPEVVTPSGDEPQKQNSWKLANAGSQGRPAQTWRQWEQGWWKWGKESVEDQMAKHFATEFNGKRGFNGQWFRRPVKQENTVPFDSAAILESDKKGRYLYRNQLGQM